MPNLSIDCHERFDDSITTAYLNHGRSYLYPWLRIRHMPGHDAEIALCGICPLTFLPVSKQNSKFAEYLEHRFAGVLQPQM
jgi:hypothetical protein